MSKFSRVANHLRYFRSNGMTILATFIFVLASGLVGQSLLQSASRANAEQGGYESQEGYGEQYDRTNHCNTTEYRCYPTHTPRPTPTYRPHPTYKPDPQFICTWMKAAISDRTVALYASGNLSHEARIHGYVFDFGDGYVTSTSGPASHAYGRHGTYYTKAWIKYIYEGRLHTTAPCTLIVKVEYPQPQPTYKPYPTYVPIGTYRPYQKPHHDNRTDCDCNREYEDDNSQPPVKDEDYRDEDKGDDDSDGGAGTVNNNINNNNSSATANVVVTPGVSSGEPVISKAGYSGGGEVFAADGQMPTELPKTGIEELASTMNLVGASGLVAAGVAYASSRRELADIIFKRN